MTVSGNLFTELTDGVDHGIDFNASGFSYVKTGGTAIGNLTILPNGDYTYEPDPTEVPVTGTNTVCCNLTFTQTVASTCNCEDTATFCFIIDSTGDPCAGFFHCALSTPGTCIDTVQVNLMTLSDATASCVTGFTGARTYSWNPTSGANNFAGANPTVDAGGDCTYEPDESESNGSAAFAIDVTEGACTSTFLLTINFNDFCSNFFVNDLTVGP